MHIQKNSDVGYSWQTIYYIKIRESFCNTFQNDINDFESYTWTKSGAVELAIQKFPKQIVECKNNVPQINYTLHYTFLLNKKMSNKNLSYWHIYLIPYNFKKRSINEKKSPTKL